jgi:hypothetical protein
MARRQKGGIDARQSDEFGQQFFRARHGGRMSQPARGRKGIAAPNPRLTRPCRDSESLRIETHGKTIAW